MFAQTYVRTYTHKRTNITKHMFAKTPNWGSAASAGGRGGMLASRDVFTLLVVEKNGKKRLVVCFGFVVGGVCFPPRFTLIEVGSR